MRAEERLQRQQQNAPCTLEYATTTPSMLFTHLSLWHVAHKHLPFACNLHDRNKVNSARQNMMSISDELRVQRMSTPVPEVSTRVLGRAWRGREYAEAVVGSLTDRLF